MNNNQTDSPPQIQVEQMNEIFTKYHLNQHGEQPWPFRPVIHHFKGPDVGNPHDHPWSFTTFILAGGYVEEVYTIAEDGSWSMEVHHRRPGSSHHVQATHIHRIIELPEGECWTMVISGPNEREPHFWKFNDKGIYNRPWFRRTYRRWNRE
jgi:hypothetical protein